MTEKTKSFYLAAVCALHARPTVAPVGSHVKITFVLNEAVARDEKSETENGLVRVANKVDPATTDVGSESMWVKITDVDTSNDDPVYTGFVDNDPVYIKDLAYLDEIEFKQENIIVAMPMAH